MFEISWSELLILGVVTLLFVGPKELPGFLSTIGRYLGVIRRQASEFRGVFEQALREAELDTLNKEIRDIGDGVRDSFDDATRSIDHAKAAMRVDLNTNRAIQPPATPGEPSESAADEVLEPTSVPEAVPQSEPQPMPEAAIPAAGDAAPVVEPSPETPKGQA